VPCPNARAGGFVYPSGVEEKVADKNVCPTAPIVLASPLTAHRVAHVGATPRVRPAGGGKRLPYIRRGYGFENSVEAIKKGGGYNEKVAR